MFSGSWKQKLNTKGSTEAELAPIDNAMGQVQWTHYFLAEQGEYTPTTAMYQDSIAHSNGG